MFGDMLGRVFSFELIDVFFFESLCTCIVVDIPLPLLLLLATTALLVFLGHGGWR
jgi:hypothetical protein